MRIDKSTKFFLFFALLVFSILLLNSCTDYDSTITAGSNPISSTYYIKAEESSFPLNVALKEGESVYLEACDIKLEFAYISIDYPDYGVNTANIKADYNYGNSYTWIEYNSMNGTMRYQAENETNYNFYFNGVYFVDDHYELDFTVNRYYKL